jgi:hypothetical protein
MPLCRARLPLSNGIYIIKFCYTSLKYRWGTTFATVRMKPGEGGANYWRLNYTQQTLIIRIPQDHEILALQTYTYPVHWSQRYSPLGGNFCVERRSIPISQTSMSICNASRSKKNLEYGIYYTNNYKHAKILSIQISL